MFQTSNSVCQCVNLTDELQIGLEYDIPRGLLNIFVKNTGHLPSQINILSNQRKDHDEYLLRSSEIQQSLSRFFLIIIY